MANNVNGGSSKALANDLTDKRSLRHREDELQSLRLFSMDLVPVGFFAGFIVLLMVLLICLFVPQQDNFLDFQDGVGHRTSGKWKPSILFIFIFLLPFKIWL
ncbi:unnamed protein product [Lactuca virosa]|uniref:Uncharacterized protein n=1 Tax=Lactuca virosa TaxID=75947 RepID=A0AAU9N415_9ASTR|nr:unnamed protein product [Lactuca virosa]